MQLAVMTALKLGEILLDMKENRYQLKRINIDHKFFTTKAYSYDNYNATSRLLAQSEIQFFKKFVGGSDV